MPNLSARQMLSQIPVRMAEGGEARAFSDDEVKQFIDSTYAQFGGPGVEAHKAIADAMAQFGVGVNQVARVSGFTPREVEAEFMGQRAGARPVLDDPTGTAAGMSAAYRAAAQAGGQQTVDDYYANLRADAEAYLANPDAPTGVDAYNLLVESGISTSDLRNAGVADEVLNKIFTVSGPIEQSAFVTPTGMTSAYERSPDLAFESQRLGQEGRAILDKQGLDYITNLQKDGIDAAERAQMLEYATERGYSFDDLLKAGVDPNVLFRDDGSAAAKTAAAKAAADAAAKAAADKAAADAAAKAAADKAAADAAAKAAADAAAKAAADAAAKAAADAAAKAAAKAAADKAAADKAAADKAVVAPGVTVGDMVTAVTPTYNATQLQNIIKAAENQPAAAGTVTNPIDTRGSAATGSQSGVSKFLETYNPASPFVAPTYTAPTVYQPLPAQPDMFAAGQPALDTTFNQSPRTAILDDRGRPTGQFDYSPAAKLRPATGSGFSFTPPSITTRPRSLLSPREIQTYGGLTSTSQRFAQNRALIDRNLRDMLNATPALRNDASTYNLLRNQVMSGRFGPDPNRVFDPATSEGEQFQAYLASLAGAAPTQGVTKGTGSPIAAGGGVTVIPDIDPTDRQMNAAGIGSNVVDGTDPGGFGAITAKPLVYGGYGNYPLELFNKGGEATSSKRMLENLSGKKSEGSAKDELARFQAGGAVSARRPLSPNDPLYITEDTPPPAEEQIPLDELIRRQLEGIDNTPIAARTQGSRQSESRNMLQNIVSGASQIPGTVMDYGRGIMQSEAPLAQLGSDVVGMGGAMIEGIKEDPLGATADMLPIIGEIRSGMDAKKFSDMANEAEAAGNTALADTYRQVATLGAAGAVPFGGIGFRGARRSAMSNISDAPQRPDSIERTFQLRPTETNPFVGRLDRFIGTDLEGTTTLPALINRIQGKFRNHDIQRVKQIAQDVDPNAKFKPNEILDMLRVNYDPSAFQVQTRTVNPDAGDAFYTQDDPFKTEPNFALRRSVVILNRDNMPETILPPEATENATKSKMTLGLMLTASNAPNADVATFLQGNTLQRFTAPVLDFVQANRGSPLEAEVAPILGRMDNDVKAFQDMAGEVEMFTQTFKPSNFFRGPVFSNALRESKRILEAEGGLAPDKLLRKAELDAFNSSYRSLISEYTNGPPETAQLFRGLDSPADVTDNRNIVPFLENIIIPEVTERLGRESSLLQNSIRNGFFQITENNRLAQAIDSASVAGILGSNPLYEGNHRSLTPGVTNLISFTRATDVKADIPGMGNNVKGIYLHELQSDLVNSIRKAGGPRNLTPEQLQERLAQSQTAVDKMRETEKALQEEYSSITGLVPRDLQVRAEVSRLKDKIETVGASISSQIRAQRSIDSRLAGDPPRFGALADEPFVGASEKPRMLQQLMIKAAVKSALDRGFNFVALTSPEKNSQSQLYRMTPQNAKDVVDDLGEGFVLKKLDISSPSGQTGFSTMGIVWDQRSAGRDAVSRISTQGIPFKEGGEVTSSRRMLDNLSERNPEGRRVGGSAPAVAGRMGRSARMAAQRAEEPQSESRTMLEQLGRFTSLDTPPEMGLDEVAADIGMGFLPVVGTAQGARDFERARRDEDNLGMLLSAASMIPVAGGAVRAARSAGKAADVVEEVPSAALTAQASPDVSPNLTQFLKNSQVKEPVFHAAKADVKEFAPKYRTELSSMGFHFGTADQANFRMTQYDFDSKSPNIGKYYLNIENPLEVSHMASFSPDHLADQLIDLKFLIEDKYVALSEAANYDSIKIGNALVKILKKNGYDGLKYKNVREGDGFSFVPFNPTQIKSAIGNVGTYDPSTPVITKAKGGPVTKKAKSNNVERVRNDNRRYL